ncbi:MAG: DUF2975 domain-containing protein [Oscillospiraceae bacterium]|nr:DUF2975 domain-containing protein [Oscillospiraceae bacterium]
MKQKSLARWLKAAVIGVGVILLFVYAFVIPAYGASLVSQYPEFSNRYIPWLVFLSLTALPCICALILGWKIACAIGRDSSFTETNARRLKRIAALAAGDSAFFFLGNIVLLAFSMSHPGIMLFSLAFVFAGVAVSIAAAVLSHLVKKAAALQEQSDLTI